MGATNADHFGGIMAIKKRADAELRAQTPEKLFSLLRKTGANSDTLWPQQVDLLREYAEKRVNAKDLAIELPTGTGKTLTGLLIADWRRREGKGRSIFVCPTKQLVRQVVAAADKEGIDVVDLSGPSAQWDTAARSRYERAKATAVVAYSSIFNTSPKLIEADVIVFDDAHAGEQYVSKACTVEVPRQQYGSIWSEVLEAVAPMLPQERYHQLIGNAPGQELVSSLTGSFSPSATTCCRLLLARSRCLHACPALPAKSSPLMRSVVTSQPARFTSPGRKSKRDRLLRRRLRTPSSLRRVNGFTCPPRSGRQANWSAHLAALPSPGCAALQVRRFRLQDAASWSSRTWFRAPTRISSRKS